MTTSRACQAAAEVLAAAFGKGFVGALQDSLSPDVDPGARRHLPVHGEPECIQPAELIPGGPAGDQVGVGNQNPGRLLMSPEHPDRLPTLDQQRLIVLQPFEGCDDALVAFPIAGRLPAAAVDDQLLGPLRHRGIEVVHEHPQRGFLVPTQAGQRGTGWCADMMGLSHCGHVFSIKASHPLWSLQPFGPSDDPIHPQ